MHTKKRKEETSAETDPAKLSDVFLWLCLS